MPYHVHITCWPSCLEVEGIVGQFHERKPPSQWPQFIHDNICNNEITGCFQAYFGTISSSVHGDQSRCFKTKHHVFPNPNQVLPAIKILIGLVPEVERKLKLLKLNYLNNLAMKREMPSGCHHGCWSYYTRIEQVLPTLLNYKLHSLTFTM